MIDAYGVWVIVAGLLISTSCALLGTFLVLRKMSMIADAVGHSILPGIVLAFLVSYSRSVGVMLVGAGASALAAVWLIDWLQKRFQLKPDAATGSVYSTFFASGIVLLSLFANNVDLDQDCVLYGELAYVPLQLIFGGIPKAVFSCGLLLTLIVGFVVSFYRPLIYTSFNADFLTIKGFAVAKFQTIISTLVAITTVIAFESVGCILIVNLFVTPPLIAMQLTSRVSLILVYSCAISALCVVVGYGIALQLNVSITGVIATLSFGLLVCTWLAKNIYAKLA